MLDEFQEFSEYVWKPDDKDCPRRLKMSNLLGGGNGEKSPYSGIKRALCLICRYAYFEYHITEKEKLINLMNLWCGFEEEDIYNFSSLKGFEFINGWFPKYLIPYCNEKKNGSKTKNNYDDVLTRLLEDLKNNCKKKWNHTMYSDNASDQNSIYFDSIIAEAIEAGPLNRKYLVLKRNPIEEKGNYKIRELVDKTTGNKKTEKVLNPAKEKKICDAYLKLVAAILLNQIDKSDYSHINFSNYSNWLANETKNKDVGSRIIEVIKYINDERVLPIVFCEYLDSKNKKRPVLKLDSDWKEYYSPRIIDEKDIDTIKEGEFIFKDCGRKSGLVLETK